MKKPDRFERVVQKMAGRGIPTDHSWFTVNDVVKILRKEHRWVERMVNDVRKWAQKDIITKADITTVIISRLKQRRK